MSEITNAIRQLCEDKGLSYGIVLETIESALSAAYRKDFGSKNQNIKVSFNPESGTSKVYDVKTVVEDLPPEIIAEMKRKEEEAELARENAKNPLIKKEQPKEEVKPKEEPVKEEAAEDEEERKFNPKTEIQLSDAILIKKDAKIEDEIKMDLDPPTEYGRMAAQTAKQVIIQKIREAEKSMIISEFKDKEGEVLIGIVQRQEDRFVLIDLGKSVGILTNEEQVPGENYKPGSRVKVYVKEVREGMRGPEITLSRTSEEILRQVFSIEVPEITNGLIEIKSIAREAGSRSKVAIHATSDNIDPIGSCVGQRGARIQTIIQELNGEKVDIIEFSDSPEKFISNALSPAKILNIDTNNDLKKAIVRVANDQQSLAIGKGGQNVRLAAKLTGWSIDVVGVNPDEKIDEAKKEDNEEENKKEDKKKDSKKKEDKEEVEEVKEEKEEAKKEKESKKKEDKAEAKDNKKKDTKDTKKKEVKEDKKKTK